MKRKKLVIFGAAELAELALFYFTHDSDYEVQAFVLDDEYLTTDTFSGFPLVSTQQVQARFSSEDHHAFIALGYSKRNSVRQEKFEQFKRMGYTMASYISSRANVLTEESIGENAFILEDNTIQPFVKIGQNVTLWSGNHIGHHSEIGDHVFIASHAVISGGVKIASRAFIGVNATLRDHISIGAETIIGAGALILSDTNPRALFIGTETTQFQDNDNVRGA